MWGWNDLIVTRCGKELVKKLAPIRLDKRPVGGFAKLASRFAIAVTIHDHDGPVLRLAARLGLRELGGVERTVTAAADDDDVPQRMSLPPSMTTTVPVT
jgi:hypothetical protein